MLHRFRALSVLLITLALAGTALAGPPLLCRPYNIGAAKSLPWLGSSWSEGDPAYTVKNVVEDTLALLTPEMPVLARMETLRRATLYTRNDRDLAQQLLARLYARTVVKPKDSRNYALALFDAGYLTETYRQAHWISASAHKDFWKFQNAEPPQDGYLMVRRALELRGNDPQMEFAAAVITLDVHKDDHTQHLQRALSGAPEGSLLEKNLAAQFGEELRELRSVAQKTK